MEIEIESKFKLNREPNCCPSLGKLKPSSDLTIFYKLPFSLTDNPSPYPEQSTNYLSTIKSPGNIEYVEMPFDDVNNGSADQQQQRQRASQWSEILNKLQTNTNITTINQLIVVIKSYNQRFAKRNFNILRGFFKDQLSDDEENYFFTETLPKMIQLVVQLPDLITQPIPLLKQKTNQTLFFNQQQLASIMSNGFFCTFPERRRSPSSKIFDINFIKLFSDQTGFAYDRKMGKLACLMNYFRRITKKKPKGIISIERRYLLPNEIPDWMESNVKLSKMIVKSRGTIEEKGKGLLQINSTNRLIAADYTNYHTSLDARRFMASPEMLTIGLFTESLLNNESILITGVEQFNLPPEFNEDYDVSEHNYKDKRPFDDWGRRCTKIVSMDAKYFAADKINEQYNLTYINRDLNKAYSGFMDRKGLPAINKCSICTTNWGCGANRGDPQLKSIILLIAASVAQRDILYLTYNNQRLAKELKNLINQLYTREINVSRLYNYLQQFDDYVKTCGSNQPIESMFSFLEKQIKPNLT